jgi:hypothetical protein
MVKMRSFLPFIIMFVCFSLFLTVDVFPALPEFWISTECFSGSAYGTQALPSIARGETGLLVVWDDERITPDRDIFCTRITLEGDVLDPVGIAICTAPGEQTLAKVAAGNLNYLVVWQDYRNDTHDIYGARIDLNGNVLDPDGFPISTGSAWEESPDVAFDGTNFMVAWSDDRSMMSPDIYVTRITSGGEILDGAGIQLSSDTEMEFAPSIAFNGSNYLIAWEVGAG